MTALGSTFRTNEPLLSELLQDVDKGALQLPDFQRPWVWEDHRIRALIASLSLSYPIGAIMLMEVGDDTRFAPRPVEGTDPHKPPSTPKKLILDGQQRLTSLYRALKSGRPVKTQTDKGQEIMRWYYMDMARALSEGADHEDRTEAVVAVPEDRRIKENFDRNVRLDLSTRELEFKQSMFPLWLMYDDTAANAWFMGYQQHHNLSPEATKFFFRFMQEIRQPFLQYKVPVIELLQGTRKEAVCQVFENVNTGGVSLTVFELITATFAADDFRLRPDWDARYSQGKKDAKLLPLKHFDVLRSVNGEMFLQALALYTTYLRHKNGEGAVGAKRKDMLRLTLADYKAHADKIHAGFLEAARLLTREKIFADKNLPYLSQLVPLAAILAVLGTRAESDAVKQKLARWYWCGVFGELYGGATEGRFAHDIQQVPAWVDGGDEPRTVHDANFAPTRLLTLQSRQSAAYKGVMALLMDRGSLDLKTGDPIHVTTHMSEDVDIHHLFPADYCEKQQYPKLLWNSVVNKAPLTAKTNRSIGGRAPSHYLAPIEKDLGAKRLDDILHSHGVDPAVFRADDFHGFLRLRAGVIIQLIEKATGRSVSGRNSEETIKAFGAEV